MIAALMADLYWTQDERDANRLATKKTAGQVCRRRHSRQHGREKKELRIAKRALEYRIALYESLFPFIKEVAFSGRRGSRRGQDTL